MVVDDDPDMRAYLLEVLKPAYDVSSAVDGAEGLDLVRRSKPDLVILDLLMPRMHGFEVCRKIREDAELSGTKVLISSSKSYQHDQRTALEGGADRYLVKPYGVADLMKTVEELLGAA